MFSALLKAPSFKLQIQIRLYVLLIKEKKVVKTTIIHDDMFLTIFYDRIGKMPPKVGIILGLGIQTHKS